jgi:hypothetical protein
VFFLRKFLVKFFSFGKKNNKRKIQEKEVGKRKTYKRESEIFHVEIVLEK